MVEIAVVCLIAVNVLVILWQVFIADQKRFARDQGKLAALQGALLFAERLEADLREIALKVPSALAPNQPFTLDNPVQIGDQNRRLSFRTFLPQNPSRVLVPVQHVEYAFDPDRSRIVRTAGAERARIRNLLVDSIRFEGASVTLKLGALGLAPLPKLFRPELPVYLVKYQITACPDVAGGAASAVPAEQKVTLVNAVPMTYRAERANHPYWSFNSSELAGEP